MLFLKRFLLCFIRQSLSLGPGANQARQAGQPAPEIHLSPPTGSGTTNQHHHALLFFFFYGAQFFIWCQRLNSGPLVLRPALGLRWYVRFFSKRWQIIMMNKNSFTTVCVQFWLKSKEKLASNINSLQRAQVLSKHISDSKLSVNLFRVSAPSRTLRYVNMSYRNCKLGRCGQIGG